MNSPAQQSCPLAERSPSRTPKQRSPVPLLRDRTHAPQASPPLPALLVTDSATRREYSSLRPPAPESPSSAPSTPADSVRPARSTLPTPAPVCAAPATSRDAFVSTCAAFAIHRSAGYSSQPRATLFSTAEPTIPTQHSFRLVRLAAAASRTVHPTFRHIAAMPDLLHGVHRSQCAARVAPARS